MIEQIRGEIRTLNERIEENNDVIRHKEEQIDELRVEINTLRSEINNLEDDNDSFSETIREYEQEIESLQQKDNLVEQLTEIAQNLTVEQLQAIIDAANNPGETPAVHINVQAPERVIESANDVRFEDLTDEMHNATITVVGMRHQDYFKELHKSPEIGDIVTLHKETDSSNTYAVLNGHVIGVMPAGPSKIEQLETIGANYVRNQDLTPDSEEIGKEYEVVGVIPGCFAFLNPSTSTTLEVETPDDAEIEIIGSASTIQDARTIFRNNMPDTCQIMTITEENNKFFIDYLNHRSNTMENYRNQCIVMKL